MSVVPRTYDKAHKNLKRQRGPARDYDCRCGQPAVEWAYQFTAGDQELRDDEGRFPHSLNPDDYEPMCRPCHSTLDIANDGRRLRVERVEIVYRKTPVAKQRRRCLQCGLIGAPGAIGNHQRWYRHTGLEDVAVC